MTRQFAAKIGSLVLMSGCRTVDPNPVAESYEIIVDCDALGGFYVCGAARRTSL